MTEVVKITPDMTIGEAVQEFPSIVEVLQSEGVHCVGCGAAYHETIHDGLAGHGKTEDEINEVLKKLNNSIPKESGSSENLIITEKAADKLKQIVTSQQKDDFGLRVKVIKGGCAGFSYDFSLDDTRQENDTIVEVNGSKFFIDFESLEQLKGSKLDYADTLTGAGFKISNPNAEKSCACGQSFR
jgi:iron-sulfur cluster assembly protein